MKKLIDLSTKKLELLKKNGDPRKILELDIAFNNAYNEFLNMNNVDTLEAIDHSTHKEELMHLKSIVTTIYTLEMSNAKKSSSKKSNHQKKKITSLYKKNMK